MPFYNRNIGTVHQPAPKPKPAIQKAVNFHTYFKAQVTDLQPRVTSFVSKNMAQIYGFPTPLTTPIVIGVISLGGGLYGTVTNNILTNGDVQAYWTSQGITNHPKVVIIPVGATNSPASDPNATIENTIDVETIGSCCPGTNVTILFYIAPNSFAGFYNAFNSAINTPVIVNGQNLLPSVISCSWGTPEVNLTSASLTQFNTLFGQAVAKGINICCASGDNGSSDGLPGLNVDFPSCSPNVVACGGTTLVCPTLSYAGAGTSESTWNGSGGGVSRTFLSPTYQTNLQKTYRSSPDIALNADPNTGVIYRINGASMIVGGTSIVSPAISALLGALGINTFFNTKLYSLKRTAFNDIISGNNGGYSATLGYDNTTGFGSINGADLVNQLANWVPVSSITMNITNQSLNINQTTQLTTTIGPTNATNPSVVWKTSNATIATVSQSGLVTARAVGSATITATTNDGWKLATTAITVQASPIVAVTGVTLSPASTAINVGQTYASFVATVAPANASLKALTWTSSNTAVATINTSGVVTGRANGTTTITVRTVDGLKTATSLITVVTPVTTISLNSIQIAKNSTITLIPSIQPTSSSYASFTWTSSNPSIATVNSSGAITSTSTAGTITITARATNIVSGTNPVTATWSVSVV